MNQNMQNVEDFLLSISPWESAYAHVGFSYFAIQSGQTTFLLQGRLFLHTTPQTIPIGSFSTDRIRAGHFLISDFGFNYRDFINDIVTKARVVTPIGELVIPTNQNDSVTTYFVPFHQEGLSSGTRVQMLSLSGANRHSYLQQPQADWELKSSSIPFDSINELLNEYFLGGYRGDYANIEVIAFNVSAIDFGSIVKGNRAYPKVFLATNLDKSKSRINYRVLMHGKVLTRKSIDGLSLNWTMGKDVQIGTTELDIPEGSVLHCVASYNGHAQHQGWLADPENSQNPRRACLEEVDDKLEVLRDYLFEEQKQRRESRDFEFGVAWLMWAYGFNVAQCGATARTSDALDIVATTPKGNFLAIECTTGLLKLDNKLPKLVERTELLRKKIQSSGSGHLRVLPVMVTAKTREEVRAELDQARQLGVAVVTKEFLLDALQKTIAAPDPDQLFEDAWQDIFSKQQQLELPSIN